MPATITGVAAIAAEGADPAIDGRDVGRAQPSPGQAVHR
jgi:hypothetical protein